MASSLSFAQSAFVCSQSHQFCNFRPKLSSSSSTFGAALTIEAKTRTRREDRQARHVRIRKKVEGTPERPRLSVFRSNKHIYAQVIDDSKMHTLASASTMQKAISEQLDFTAGPTIEVAKKVGEIIAKSCLEKGIMKVAFDRGGYPYHGRIEALADAAREHGLQF
ncbi:50S ribosomal protein L18, chloroplastic-like [Papaver somniferum]|uniref:50S ribosomal protein L18, chloroplastic-like n=1 Tax=Papaver somniferum TaxID=3469 RepID=UPI000E6FA9EF|nr:50S ribosomal protein L18, chloroplastic-like [Papaver somniferum]